MMYTVKLSRDNLAAIHAALMTIVIVATEEKEIAPLATALDALEALTTAKPAE